MSLTTLLMIKVILLIDRLIGQYVQLILGQARIRELWGRWQGLAWLMQYRGDHSEIRLLSLTADECVRDLLGCQQLHASALYHKLYTQEFEQAGACTLSVCIVDFPWLPRQNGLIPTLRMLSEIASLAFLPMLMSLPAEWWHCTSYEDITSELSFATMLQQTEYADWVRALRQQSYPFIFWAMPEVLIVKNNYECQISAGYCVVSALLQCYHEKGWFYDLRDPERQEWRVRPLQIKKITRFDQVPGPNLSLRLSEVQHHDCQTVGIQTLSQPYPHDWIYCHLHALPAMLALARFAHYLKVMLRDRLGSRTRSPELLAELSQWCRQYCADTDSRELAVLYPLRDCAFQLREDKTKSGGFECEVELTLNGIHYETVHWKLS